MGVEALKKAALAFHLQVEAREDQEAGAGLLQ
jgi:hypothetical protein